VLQLNKQNHNNVYKKRLMLKRKETSHLSRPWLERYQMASLFVKNAHSLKRTKLGEKSYWGRSWRCSTMVKEPVTQVITGDVAVAGRTWRLRFGGEGGLWLWDGVKHGVIWKAPTLRKFACKWRYTTTTRSLGWCRGSHQCNIPYFSYNRNFIA